MSLLLFATLFSVCQADEFTSLIAWAKKHGATMGSVLIKNKADGQRGLFAAATLKKDDMAVSIPIDLAMCPQSFVKTELGKELLSNDELAASVVLDETGLLTVLLLGEVSKKDSYWAPYLASLPKDMGGAVAITFEDSDSSLFQGTISEEYLGVALRVLRESVQKLEVFFTKHADLVRKHYPEIDVSKGKLQWAVAMVQSRQVVIATGEQRHACLAPIIDMMNHRPNAHNADVDATGEHLAQVMKTNVKTGQEVFTNYGALSVELAFTHYGFGTAEMAVNLGPHFRKLMEQSLEDPAMMPDGQAHAENVAKQLVAKRCHGIDDSAQGGVVDYVLLKRVLQCSRILSCGPAGLEILIRREPEEPEISNRPFDFPAEMKALETWVEFFEEQRVKDDVWRTTDAAKVPADARTPKQNFVIALRNRERLFIKYHLKELRRLYDSAPELSDLLDKDSETWAEKTESKNQFKLTDDVVKMTKEREAEEKRVQDALQGSFTDVGNLGGSHHDEF